MNVHGVILAGGMGTRFWPVSRAAHPKQFLDVLGIGKSLLQATYGRLRQRLNPDHIWVVGAQMHAELLRAQLPELDRSHLLLEPLQRNTAPSILWASTYIHAHDPEAVLWIVPADHYIPDEADFLALMDRLFAQCNLHKGIYTVGIRPTSPHTGYGYIQYLPSSSEEIFCYKVKTFTEKPSRELAEVFLQSGDFLWNSGMFIARASTLLQAYEKHAPELYELLSDVKEYEEGLLRERFQQCPSISFDYAIMEKYEEVYVVEGKFRWWDLGGWEAVYQVLPHDAQGNVFHGQVLSEGVKDSFVFGAVSGRLIYVVGLEGYLVVDTADALLILPRAQEQHIRGIVGRLQAEGKDDYL
jgi:mannose-1-phosphate guanylyltransferase